jgi:lysyl-tRNA synthetase class 2
MRRSPEGHPNGLLDFVLVRTIEHLRDQGCTGLALNFAAFRAQLAGTEGDGTMQRGKRWMLQRMSSSMQIESLWRFTGKYHPDWQPRYALYDSLTSLLPSALAVARAEAFWELPFIGRYLTPRTPAVGGTAI